MEESISIARVATSPFCPRRAPERFHQGRAMLLIGFAGIGFMTYRKRKSRFGAAAANYVGKPSSLTALSSREGTTIWN